MSDISKVYDEWKKYIEEYPNEANHNNILHEVWTPRVKWFRPPMWKIFRWAYKIKKSVFMNCYPVSCRSSSDLINKDADIKFSIKNHEDPKIDAIAAERCKFMNIDYKTIDDVIGNEFSRNEVIAIWAANEDDPMHDHLVYRGEAWATPDDYLDLTISRYIGVTPENKWEGATINILVKEYSNDIVCGLPKKKHDISGCTEGGQNEC